MSAGVRAAVPACLCFPFLSQSSAFPLCPTLGSPPLCLHSLVPFGHPACAFWSRSSTPALDRLLCLLAVLVGLADHLHYLPPAPALPPEQRGWPAERCDAMLSWHTNTSSDPASRREQQTGLSVGCCMSPIVETVVLPLASPVGSPASWCLGADESLVSLSSSLSSIGYPMSLKCRLASAQLCLPVFASPSFPSLLLSRCVRPVAHRHCVSTL